MFSKFILLLVNYINILTKVINKFDSTLDFIIGFLMLKISKINKIYTLNIIKVIYILLIKINTISDIL